MKYPSQLKEKVIVQMMPPVNAAVSELSKEFGVAEGRQESSTHLELVVSNMDMWVMMFVHIENIHRHQNSIKHAGRRHGSRSTS